MKTNGDGQPSPVFFVYRLFTVPFPRFMHLTLKKNENAYIITGEQTWIGRRVWKTTCGWAT